MPKSEKFLRSLLETLAQEWSLEKIRDMLDQLNVSNGNDFPKQAENHPENRVRKSGSKRSAVQQVELLISNEERRQLLLEIAVKFDSGKFLPSNSDVREFLILMSMRPKAIKNRADAFRALLLAFERLSVKRLAEIARLDRYSGPSQLGALSDAIANAGEQLVRHKEANKS